MSSCVLVNLCFWDLIRSINEPEFTERHKKAFKDRGNRLNLNIFLSHSTNSQEGSDAESSNESMTILNKENNNMAKSDVQSNCNATSDSNSNSNNNISNDSDNNSNNQVPTKKVPDPSVAGPTRRRPPLVRAMSAPIRPKNDESASMASGVVDPATNKASQAKRKLKKKKNLVSREARDDVLEEKLDENDNELDDISNSSDSASNLLASASPTTNFSSNSGNSSASSSNETKKQTKLIKKATLQRPRSAAVGNEVVTLVSLLSSGGSDSEKEDNHAAQPPAGTAATVVLPSKSDIIDFSVRHRAPMLRKSGKSVSFQERDLPPEIPSSTKDFSKYRRGSVAPIAARIRSNRPPTAPAGSIYLCDIDTNNDDFMKSFKINSNYDNDNDNINNNNNNNRNGNKTGAAQLASGEAKSDEIEEIEINYPENVRTPKEKECWKLYQKMLNRGVTVSYDTILRGMLTPTELRIIQKQNESKQNYDVDAAGVCDGNGCACWDVQLDARTSILLQLS